MSFSAYIVRNEGVKLQKRFWLLIAQKVFVNSQYFSCGAYVCQPCTRD